jgi:ribosomal protein S18 acetylase RimI-like enzyme
LSNEGDRENLLAHPELLEFDAAALDNGATRVAVVDGLVVGFATLRLVDDMAAELDDLFVDPDWMRNGVARALVSDLVEAAKRRGIARIDVAANGHAMGFYEAAGFIADGTVETTFGPATHMHLNVV